MCGGGGAGYIPGGGSLPGGGGGGGGVTTINVSSAAEWNAALATVKNGGNGTSGGRKNYTINVTSSFSVPGSIANTFGGVQYLTVNLTGTGAVSLSGPGNLLRLDANQTLVINGSGLVLQGLTNGQNGATEDNDTSLVYLDSSAAVLELRNGTITGNSGDSSNISRGVYVGSGSFAMSGGEITGNSAVYGGGGGVYVAGGSFTMNGTAKITNNISVKGGGVHIAGGSFTMSDGEISGNFGIGGGVHIDGDGVHVDSGGSFAMSGTAKIINNRGAMTSPGGVYVANGSFTMSGGEISGNTGGNTVGGGGGVHVDSNGSFTMLDGTISGNGAFLSGGGVYIYIGEFNKSGGIIYGYYSADPSNPLWNTARCENPQSTWGHAVFFYKDAGNQYYCDTTLDTIHDISTGTLPPNPGPGNTVGNWIKQ
jgi:hypothetical protein